MDLQLATWIINSSTKVDQIFDFFLIMHLS